MTFSTPRPRSTSKSKKASPPRLSPSPAASWRCAPLAASTTPSLSTVRRRVPGDRDRFIPSRRGMEIGLCRRSLLSPPSERPWKSPTKKEFDKEMLNFLCNLPKDYLNLDSDPRNLLSLSQNTSSRPDEKVRKEPSVVRDPDWVRDPEKESLQTVLSWGANNLVAVAYEDQIDIIDHRRLERCEDDNCVVGCLEDERFDHRITSLAWCNQPGKEHLLAAGTEVGNICIWDVNSMAMKSYFENYFDPDEKIHNSALDWNPTNDMVLTSGYLNGRQINADLRTKHKESAWWFHHGKKVTKQKWNSDGVIFASSHETQELNIATWDFRMVSELCPELLYSYFLPKNNTRLRILSSHYLDGHVKALDWCPFLKGAFVAGGTGKDGQEIVVYDSYSRRSLACIKTNSDVTNLVCSQSRPEIYTSHGQHSVKENCSNSLQVWEYNSRGSLTQTKVIPPGKEGLPVLDLALNPQTGTEVATLTPDGSLTFWDVSDKASTYCSEAHKRGYDSTIIKDCMNPSEMWTLGFPHLKTNFVIR